MLTKVEIRTAFGGMLPLPLQDLSGGYLVKNIDGLDPVKATLVYSSFAGQDGSQFQSARRENRTITIKLKYASDYLNNTPASLRQKLFQYVMPKSLVQLRFYDDIVGVVNISGRVETFDSPRFAMDPEVTIGIVCENSDFDTLSNLQFGGMTTEGIDTINYNYLGTVDSGFLFTMYLNRSIGGFTIYNTLPDNTLKIFSVTAPMIATDQMRVTTAPGNKTAMLTRYGTPGSVMYGVAPASTWITLVPGLNRLRIATAGAGVPWTIDHTTKFGGI
jgi:hypothetical protein